MPFLDPFSSYLAFSAFRGERCSVSPNSIAISTKVMAYSESPTLVSYMCSIETCSLSRTIFKLFLVFIYNGISYLGLPKWGGLPLKSPYMVKAPKMYAKQYTLNQITSFDILMMNAMRADESPKQLYEGSKNSTAKVYIYHVIVLLPIFYPPKETYVVYLP